jgi:hypothetical protein
MTIGRSAANSIKIKTDGEASLRAVSCGCCGSGPSCGFPAFSYGATEPTNKAKFKYITLEYQLPSYQFGEFDGSREPFSISCSPYEYYDEEGNLVEGVTCSTFGETQNIARQNKYEKITYYLKEDCTCDIVKAQGTHDFARSFHSSWCNSDHYGDYADCWVHEMDYAFSSTIQDAVWSTVTENGITLLNQKLQQAKWHNTNCNGFTSGGCAEPWDGCDVNDVMPPICPSWPLYCEPLSFHAPEFYEGLSGAVEGGFRVRSGTIELQIPIYRDLKTAVGTWVQTLHNTLSEKWGPTTEMRP